MRIGELLQTRLGLSSDELSRALDEQARNGGRLCSLLISRGAIEFDIGARALGEQWGTPCALARHLANRDPHVAQLISPELARELCVLPIGRTSTGAVIVAVRDPDPRLHAALQDAIGAEVAMAITPATRLERLVIGVYGDHLGEFEVDLDSRVDMPVPSPSASSSSLSSPSLSSPSLSPLTSSAFRTSGTAPSPSASSLMSPLEMLPPSPEPAVPHAMQAPAATPHAMPPHAMSPPSSTPSYRSSLTPSPLAAAALAAPSLPPLPDLDLLNPDTLRMSLSTLDDSRVARDPSQSGMTLSSPTSSRLRAQLPPVAQTLATTRAALAFAETRDSATDVAMTFISGRWRSALIFAVRGVAAIGYRGHAVANVTGVELRLEPTSTIGRVVASKQPVALTESAVAGDPLWRSLNMPSAIVAAPLVVAGDVIAVIAAGDSAQGPGDSAAIGDLAGIATALGEAYERIRRA